MMKTFLKNLSAALILLCFTTTGSANEINKNDIVCSLRSRSPRSMESQLRSAAISILGDEFSNKFVLPAIDFLCSPSIGLSKDSNIGIYLVAVNQNHGQIQNTDSMNFCLLGVVDVNDDAALKQMMFLAKLESKKIGKWVVFSDSPELIKSIESADWIISNTQEKIVNAEFVCELNPKFCETVIIAVANDFQEKEDLDEGKEGLSRSEGPSRIKKFLNGFCEETLKQLSETDEIFLAGKCRDKFCCLELKIVAKAGTDLEKSISSAARHEMPIQYSFSDPKSIIAEINVSRNITDDSVATNLKHLNEIENVFQCLPDEELLPQSELSELRPYFSVTTQLLRLFVTHMTGEGHMEIGEDGKILSVIGIRSGMNGDAAFKDKFFEQLLASEFAKVTKLDNYQNFEVFRFEMKKNGMENIDSHEKESRNKSSANEITDLQKQGDEKGAWFYAISEDAYIESGNFLEENSGKNLENLLLAIDRYTNKSKEKSQEGGVLSENCGPILTGVIAHGRLNISKILGIIGNNIPLKNSNAIIRFVCSSEDGKRICSIGMENNQIRDFLLALNENVGSDSLKKDK